MKPSTTVIIMSGLTVVLYSKTGYTRDYGGMTTLHT
jgi:hypothetical protein